jgi:hypothetical protein
VETNRQKWPRWQVLVVFALAMAVRMCAANAFPLNAAHDPDAYLRIGTVLRSRGTYSFQKYGSPTAYRPPLYPLIVAAVSLDDRSELHPLAAVHVLLGGATAALTLLIAAHWGLSKRGSLVAAALVTIDPILLNQSVQPMTETLAAFLAALGLLCLPTAANRLSAREALLAGVVLGLAELCRPTFLVWALLCAAGLVVLARSWQQRLFCGGSFALGLALVIAPWAVRNYVAFDRPILTTTHGGYTLLLANNADFYAHLASGFWFSPWDAEEIMGWDEVEHADDEIETDRRYYEAAYETIRKQPRMFVVSCFYRFSRLWGVCPLATDTDDESIAHRALRYSVAVFYSAELALAAWGAWLVGRNWLKTPWLWGLLLVLSFTAVHSVYWTDMRMRAPLTIVVALAAGFALGRQRLCGTKQSIAAQAVAIAPAEPNLP